MARLNQRPVIFALSNPTSASECTADNAYRWTEGRAVFASGSPFSPVTIAGTGHVPGQGNNSFIFPGVGLGLLVSGAQRVVDEMFSAAAQALAAQVSVADLASGRVFPAPSRMRAVALSVATVVARVAFERGLATVSCPSDLQEHIAAFMYDPAYA
jgi:malate dehydrogenase (oxaloacetate-decarboxylating)(NADP+)